MVVSNQGLHSPIGPLAVASHHPLNYQISKCTTRGTYFVAKFNYHLFSVFHTVTILPTSGIINKTNWLKIEGVYLACIVYEALTLTLSFKPFLNAARCTIIQRLTNSLFLCLYIRIKLPCRITLSPKKINKPQRQNILVSHYPLLSPESLLYSNSICHLSTNKSTCFLVNNRSIIIFLPLSISLLNATVLSFPPCCNLPSNP